MDNDTDNPRAKPATVLARELDAEEKLVHALDKLRARSNAGASDAELGRLLRECERLEKLQ